MMRIDGHRTPTAAMPCAANVWTKNIKPQRTTKPCREKLNVYGIAWVAWWLDLEDLRKCSIIKARMKTQSIHQLAPPQLLQEVPPQIPMRQHSDQIRQPCSTLPQAPI